VLRCSVVAFVQVARIARVARIVLSATAAAVSIACATAPPDCPQTPARLGVIPSDLAVRDVPSADGVTVHPPASPSNPPGKFSTPLFAPTATVNLGETPGSGAAKKVYRGRPIDLDVKGADLHDVCRLIAEVGHVNVVVADDVKGAVTIKMHDVPWDQALDVILRAKGYVAEREGNVILVHAP
jgi:hypothetical protein